MEETDEDKEFRYFKEVLKALDAEVEQDMLYFRERSKESEADLESDLRYFAERLKEDEHKLQEAVCPMCGQPLSEHGDEEIQAPELPI